jgi:hypothetical protein
MEEVLKQLKKYKLEPIRYGKRQKLSSDSQRKKEERKDKICGMYGKL